MMSKRSWEWLMAVSGFLFMSATAGEAQDRKLSVTVYNQDLGAVRDERVLTVKEGRDTLRFTDVPARIDPTSVRVPEPARCPYWSLIPLKPSRSRKMIDSGMPWRLQRLISRPR